MKLHGDLVCKCGDVLAYHVWLPHVDSSRRVLDKGEFPVRNCGASYTKKVGNKVIKDLKCPCTAFTITFWTWIREVLHCCLKI